MDQRWRKPECPHCRSCELEIAGANDELFVCQSCKQECDRVSFLEHTIEWLNDRCVERSGCLTTAIGLGQQSQIPTWIQINKWRAAMDWPEVRDA